MKVVSFKLDEDMIKVLETLAKKKNTTKSEIIRNALIKYINDKHEEPFITKRIVIY